MTSFVHTAARAALFAAALHAATTSAHVPAATEPAANAELASLADRYVERSFELNPFRAMWAGEVRFADRFVNTLTAEHRARERALSEETLAALQKIDVAKLNEFDRLTHEVLRYRATMELEAQQHAAHLMPFNQFRSMPLTLVQLASTEGSQPFRTVADYEAFLKRLGGFPGWVDSAIANMREGIERGIVLPKVLTVKALAQLKTQVVADPEKSGFYRPVLKFPAGFSPAERTRLTVAYRALVADALTPAMTRLAGFVEKEYLPKCRDSAGIGALPGGAARYAFLARESTTTDFTPEQIHAMGLKEVARIRGEMDGVRKQVGFDGDLAAFLASITRNPKLTPFKTEEEVIEAYRAIQRRVEPRVAPLFAKLPRAKLEIRAEPELTRATAAAHYSSGAPDGSRPGVFYAPVRDPATYTTPRMTALFLHEGLPGHHFEVSLGQESELTRFRRTTRFNAYSEGWALYAESLGQEMGVYEDPYQFMGRLLSEMHRAIRLVVDTGLHVKGWTREQAIAYSLENNGGRPQDQAQEIERYMAIPGQALAYKVGEIKIFDLRRLAEQKLGARFSLPKFHTEVLKDGNLPLAVLEAKLRRWIERQAAAGPA